MNSLYSLKAGTRLDGRYIVMDVIGEGGFGITYLGFDERLEMKVAVKEYFPQHLAARMNTYGSEVEVTRQSSHESYEKGKKRFLEEAMILGRLESEDGIVDVKDYFEENNTAYFVMEYLDGEDLETVLDRDGVMDIDDVLLLLEPVMESLERVHLEGLIHRDISPDNIILTKNGTAKLVDFGAARDYMVEADSKTVILKPGYAPEEQYRTDEEQGPWTDIYALAATIYRCITGLKLPDACRRAAEDCLSIPSELGVRISDAQEHALMKGLAVYAEDRYQNMAEFRQALMEPEQEEYVPEDDRTGLYGRRFSDEPAGIRPALLLGAAGLIIALSVGSVLLFRLLWSRPSESEDRLNASREYQVAESGSQTNPGEKSDSADAGDGKDSGQSKEDSGDQKADKRSDPADGPEGFTGFGESWDKSKISQDSVDEKAYGSTDEESEEDIRADQGADSSNDREDGSTEELTEHWPDDREEETTEEPGERWSEESEEEPAEAPGESQPGDRDDESAKQSDSNETGTTESLTDSERTADENTEQRFSENDDDIAPDEMTGSGGTSASTEAKSGQTGSTSNPADEEQNGFRDEFDDAGSAVGGEKADPIEESTESEQITAPGESQAASTETVGESQAASTETVGESQAASTETVENSQAASTEAPKEDPAGQREEETIVDDSGETASTESLEEIVASGEEGSEEQIQAETPAGETPEEIVESGEGGSEEQIQAETPAGETPEEIVESGEGGSEEQIQAETPAGETPEVTVEAENGQEGNWEDPSVQVETIDAVQADYASLSGYPDYISEGLDLNRYQVTSLLDSEGVVKKNIITDSQTGITAEVYHKDLSPEQLAAGNVSLKDTAICTYVRNPEGGECRAYFQDGRLIEYLGPDGQLYDYGEGIDYQAFLDSVNQETDGGMSRLLLDMTAPGWES